MKNQTYESQRLTDHLPFSVINTPENVDLNFQQSRTKLWELDHNYHCAVIGTCLTLDEVKKTLRSFKIPVDNLNSYDIHTTIVTIISQHNFRSKKVQSYLNKKFKIAIQKTKKMNAAELILEWKRVVNNGELIATFWAVIAHPRTTEQMKRDFYGDIHMQSHMAGASNRVDLKRLTSLEKEQKKVDSQRLSQQKKHQKLQTENTRLLLKVQRQTEIMSDFNNQISALSNANEQLTILKNVAEIDQLKTHEIKLKHTNNFLSNEVKKFEEKLKQLNNVVLVLKHQSTADETKLTKYKNEIEYLQFILSQNKTKDKCIFKKQGLCGQCILYVGGKTSLVPYYRELIEAKAGVFLHHDGGIEKSTQNLSYSLNRADMVIFPSDCLSHDAYWKIKSICKKQQKPYKYLNSPGLHSLSILLDNIEIKSKETETTF